MSPPLGLPDEVESPWTFPSYGLRRVQAALLEDPRFADLELTTLTASDFEPEALAAELAANEPDLVGFSAYVWSFATFLATARRLKQKCPDCTVVFGGPAADPAMCDLPIYADSRSSIDALVLGDGEITIQEIAAARPFCREALVSIPGLALPTSTGWLRTPPRTLDTHLDALPSPNQMGLMPRDQVGYLETYRGCPLSCSFCEWGTTRAGARFSRAYLVRELTALAAARPTKTFLLDAALNLDQRAFRNLVAADEEVGYFRDHDLLCLFYPSFVSSEHLEFLASVRHVYASVGLQSLDDEVLAAVKRKSGRGRLKRILADVANLPSVGSVQIELILGLPTDTPAKFRRTIEEVLELGHAARVFHCLVLPNGLMTRAPAEHEIEFDQTTLKLISAAGWPEAALRQERDRLSDLAEQLGGYSSEYFWFLPDRAATETLAA